MTSDRLAILRCPETGFPLVPAGDELLTRLNALVGAGTLANRLGRRIEKRLDGGLIPVGGNLLYPIIDEIPVLLTDEAIPIGELSTKN